MYSFTPQGLISMCLHPKRSYKEIMLMLEKGDRYRETFASQDYLWLYKQILPQTTVLDIGASIGDTALYFSMHPNVKKVISIENDAYTFSILSSEIASSPFADRIKLIHGEALDVIRNMKMPKQCILKCDIEGAEYRLLSWLEQHKRFENIYAVQIEYHKGYEIIEDILKDAGFMGFNKPRQDIQGIGFIYGYK